MNNKIILHPCLANLQGFDPTTLTAQCPACGAEGALIITPCQYSDPKAMCRNGCTADTLADALDSLDIPSLVVSSNEVGFFFATEDNAPCISPESRATLQQSLAAECASLLGQHSILKCLVEELHSMGYSGDDRPACLLFLAMVSRIFDRIVSVAVKGPSSAGKSFVVDVILAFFPASAYYVLSASSERALVFDTEPIKHRMLIIVEAVGIGGKTSSYIIRSLLSEGRICYKTTIKGEDGRFAVQTIEREGPTGLITTTTAIELHKENETRYLSVTVDDSRMQTKRILSAIARGGQSKPDLSRWHALQEWLEGERCEVVIPYAPELAEMIPPVAVRLRRDFTTLLTLIRAHAALHQAIRERDKEGRVIATLFDYKVVRSIVGPLIAQGVEASVSREVRETVEAVRRLNGSFSGPTSTTQVARELSLDKSSASRRIAIALKLGYLENQETQKGRPARLTVGEPPPEDVPILPQPEALEEKCCTVARENGCVRAPSEAGPSVVAGIEANATNEEGWSDGSANK
jgi:hypothetical protein